MPLYKKRDDITEYITEGIRSGFRHDDPNQFIALRLDVKPVTVSNWRKKSKQTEKLDGDKFFGLIYLIVTKGNVDLRWLRGLLSATDLPVPDTLSPNYVAMLLRSAIIDRKKLTEEEIGVALKKLFDGNLNEFSIAENDTPLHAQLIRTTPHIIRFQALSLNRILRSLQPDIKAALSKGSQLQVLLMDPETDIVKYATKRIEPNWNPDRYRKMIEDNIEELREMREFGRILIKVFDYLPSSSIFCYDYNSSQQNICHVYFYGFRSVARPSLQLTVYELDHPDDYHFYREQFDLMWTSELTRIII